ncbi:hypothetical protein Aple_015610 [Acrocarpospora pleiomorpha]|uniref:Uncharacterized protein n=1 Tax=Acrocarpospora pleiomorpha TaxID=90975 RepID=A0A5M3XDE6_9ACTN|nr:hypothetical protein [Acrocarpospora pleiomorpha]GES18666.1 hypothetical protein Aple_015610 [Acrocarpospora pleiomorpha]
MKQIIRRCSVYAHRGRLFVLPESQTRAGFYLQTEPVQVLDATAPDAEVGEAVLKALTESKVRLRTPRRDEYETPVVVKAAGLRSYAAFEKQAKAISVEVSGDVVTIDRWEPDGTGGFVPGDRQSRIELSSVDDAELGIQVLALFAD